MINKLISIVSSRNSQMLDEDDILNETPKSSSVDLPDKTPSSPQLGRSIETAKTQTTANNVVRNLRFHPFVTCYLSCI